MSTTSKTKQSAGSLLVVNLRGLVNTRAPVRTTLEQLHISKRFNSTIVPNDDVHQGMLKSAKEHVAWMKADVPIVERILRERSEISDGRKFSESELKKSGYSSFSDLAQKIVSGTARLDGSQGMRQFFRLNSPKGGFKRSIRRPFRDGGILGENPELSKIVEKMM
ncbi:MAG: uL30 family ribosomal protein [Nitrososphaerota archaeon]|nr:uL30 family ribosomal protein [Nitrososphaerota archaeon]